MDTENAYILDKNKIAARFGEEFLGALTQRLGEYAEKWKLCGIRQIDSFSVNCLFTCRSAIYGDCVLKLGRVCRETETEYNALTEYAGTRFCRLYAADTANGAMLLERITPGTSLRRLPDLDARLDVFAGVWSALHKAPENAGAYPSYLGWVRRIAEYMRGRDGFAELGGYMDEAETVCTRLCGKYRGEMLLHGDLHHDNILLGENGTYRVIDPKGVTGDPVFDIPRFILNEFGDIRTAGFAEKYGRITAVLSEKLRIPEDDIRKLVFVETCMANCWNVEDGDKADMYEVTFTHDSIH